MSGRMQVQCPQCGTKLGLNDTSLLGRKVACANCQTAFVIADNRPQEKPADVITPVDEKEFDELFGPTPGKPMFEPEDAYDPPPRRSRSRADDYEDDDYEPRRRRKPVASREEYNRPPAWIKPVAIVCVCLVAVACVAGGIFLAVKFLGGSESEVEQTLAYLVEDSEAIVVIRVNKLSDDKLVNEKIDQLTSNRQVKEILEKSGFESVKDIDFIAVGVGNVEGFDQDFTVVVRANKDFDRTKIEGQSDQFEHDGRAYFKDRQSLGNVRDVAGFFPDNRTVVFATERNIKRILDRKTLKSVRDSRFKFVDFGQDVVFAYAPKSGDVMGNTMRRQMRGAPFSAIEDAKIQGVAFGGSLTSDKINLKLQAECENYQDASRIVSEFNTQFKQGREMMSGFVRGMPNGAALGDAFANLNVTTDGSTVVATTSIPKSILDGSPFGRGGVNPFAGGFPGMPNPARNAGGAFPNPWKQPNIPKPNFPGFRQPTMPSHRPPTFRPPTRTRTTFPRTRTRSGTRIRR